MCRLIYDNGEVSGLVNEEIVDRFADIMTSYRNVVAIARERKKQDSFQKGSKVCQHVPTELK